MGYARKDVEKTKKLVLLSPSDYRYNFYKIH